MMNWLNVALVGFVLFALLLLATLILWYRHIKKWSHIPIPKGCLPIIGHLHLLKGKSLEEFTHWIFHFSEKNGPTYVLFILWNPVIFTKDVDFGKTFLSSQKYITKSKQLDFVTEWLGLGVFTAAGQLWKERRRLITPAFHLDILSNNIPVVEKQVGNLVNYIEECSKESAAVKFGQITRLFALGAICEFAMGIPMNLCTENPEPSAKTFSDTSEAIMLALQKRFVHPLYRFDFIFKSSKLGRKYLQNLDIYNAFIKSVVEERISIHKEIIIEKPKIFMDILLDAYQKNQMDVEGMMYEVNTFIFAGNETISFSLGWIIFYLGKYNEIQEKLYHQFLSYKNRKLDMNEILKEAIYLDCVIKEIQRITSMNIFARRIDEDTHINDMFIPGGTEVNLLTVNIHFDKQNWANPEEFRPERFLKEGAEEYNFKLLPFSAGPRNCIGKRYALAELKIAVYYILSKFKIEVTKEIENPYKFKLFIDKDTEFKFTPRDCN